MTLRIILADDEALARSRLRSLLDDLNTELPVAVVAEAANGGEVLARVLDTPADVILMDIQMPGMGGLEAARHLAAMSGATGKPPAIIFVTAHDEHAIAAFELRAVDYLLKPVRQARLKEALSRIRPLPPDTAASLAPRRASFTVLERNRILQVAVAEVLYLRAEQRYVTACTREREYLLDESLVKLEEEFADEFLRLHRNCLVARRHLAGFERMEGGGEPAWQALLRDWPEKLPVSRRQLHVVREFKAK
ncbi:MAG: LytTR family DNA-binding domain-containing protein [Gallionellaceae bacterium]|nr:LytTR family DNA-binding domain-containing protein [Gallionellaceae bacterium]